MDPEQWLRQAEAALERGASPDAVNARLREVSGGDFASVDALRVVVEPASAGENLRSLGSAAKDAVKSLVRNPREHLRGAVDEVLAGYQGLTLNFGDEILDVLGGAMGREGVGEAVKERVAQMPTQRRVAAEIGGSLLPVSGGLGLLRAAGGNKLATPVQAMARTAGEGLVAGTAAGAVAGAGAAESGERKQGAVRGGLLGMGGGLALGGAAGAATQIPRAFRSAREVGQNLADAVRDKAGRGNVPTSQLRDNQRAVQKEARRGLIEPLEEAGVTPPAVTDAFVSGGGSKEVARTLQRQLRSIQSKNPNARQVLREIGEVQAGKRESLETVISFSTADELARSMSSQASRAERMGRAEEANTLVAAHDLLDEQLRTMPGFEEFKDVWARTSSNIRALKAGRKAAGPSMTADDVRAELKALPSNDAREAYLNSWANQLNARLERRMGTTGDVNNILRSGRDFDKKLRELFPNDQAWQDFKRVAEVEAASISTAQRVKVIAQAIGFLVGGTSLLGRLVTTPGQ